MRRIKLDDVGKALPLHPIRRRIADALDQFELDRGVPPLCIVLGQEEHAELQLAIRDIAGPAAAEKRPLVYDNLRCYGPGDYLSLFTVRA